MNKIEKLLTYKTRNQLSAILPRPLSVVTGLGETVYIQSGYTRMNINDLENLRDSLIELLAEEK